MNPTVEPLASLSEATVAYGERVVLESVTIDIAPGVLVGVLGPNGAGKSTLFRMLLGLVTPRSGQVSVYGRPPAEARRDVAYMPQREVIAWDFPITVEDVVLMGSYRRVGWLRCPGRAERELAHAALERVGLIDRRGTQIGRLSGGQQQRVFIARALLQVGEPSSHPRLLLLDEPLSGVDYTNAEIVIRIIAELAHAGHAILMATHDLNMVATECDQVLLLNGRVEGFGLASDVLTPERLSRVYGVSALFGSPGAPRFFDDGAHHHHGAHGHTHGG